MDGVLIDTEPEFLKAEIKMCRDMGITLTEEHKRQYVGRCALDVMDGIKSGFWV